MRLSRNTLHKAAAAVALGSGLAISSFASAGLVYDLRFTDGTREKPAAAGTYSVDLWAQVSGANTDKTDDAFQYGLITVLSQDTNGGGITGGISAAAINAKGGFSTLAGSRNGGGSDLNGDGVGDWGSLSTSQTDTNYMFARSATPQTGFDPHGQLASNGSWEYKLGTFTVNVTGAKAGNTSFKVAKPGATENGAVAASYAAYYPDWDFASTMQDVNAQNATSLGVYSDSTGITFTGGGVIPEPASLGLLGLGVLGLIRRRRA